MISTFFYNHRSKRYESDDRDILCLLKDHPTLYKLFNNYVVIRERKIHMKKTVYAFNLALIKVLFKVQRTS